MDIRLQEDRHSCAQLESGAQPGWRCPAGEVQVTGARLPQGQEAGGGWSLGERRVAAWAPPSLTCTPILPYICRSP